GGAFSKKPLSHHRLAWSITQDAYLPKSKEDDGHKLWSELATEIKNSKFVNFLISSEAFFSPYLDLDLIRRTLSDVRLNVIVYLRRQDQGLESNYGTNIMMPYPSVDSIHAFIEYSKPSLNYSLMLDRWEALDIVDRLIVLPFERAQLKNNDIIEDFLYGLPF